MIKQSRYMTEFRNLTHKKVCIVKKLHFWT